MTPPPECTEDNRLNCEHRFTVLETKLDEIGDKLDELKECRKTWVERAWQFIYIAIAAAVGALFGSSE